MRLRGYNGLRPESIVLYQTNLSTGMHRWDFDAGDCSGEKFLKIKDTGGKAPYPSRHVTYRKR